MKCKKCGLEINPGSKFCNNCGSKVEYMSSTLNEVNNNQAMFPDKKNKLNPVQLIFIFIAIFIVMLMMFLIVGKNIVDNKEKNVKDDLEYKVNSFKCGDTVYFGSDDKYCKEEFNTYLDDEKVNISIEYYLNDEDELGLFISMNNKKIYSAMWNCSVQSIEKFKDLLVIKSCEYQTDACGCEIVSIFNNKGEEVISFESEYIYNYLYYCLYYYEDFKIADDKLVITKYLSSGVISELFDLYYEQENINITLEDFINDYGFNFEDSISEKYEYQYLGNSKFSDGNIIEEDTFKVKDCVQSYNEDGFCHGD